MREMIFSSRMLARVVRMSSCMPSQKNAFSGSGLRLVNGRTATDFWAAAVRPDEVGSLEFGAGGEISPVGPFDGLTAGGRVPAPAFCAEIGAASGARFN